MAAITPQQITETGTADVTFTAAAGGGDTIAHHPTLLVIVKNDSGGSITVTVSEQLANNTVPDGEYGNLAKSDATLAVAGGDIGIFGPFKQKSFKDTSGNINLSYSGVTSLTIAGIYT